MSKSISLSLLLPVFALLTLVLLSSSTIFISATFIHQISCSSTVSKINFDNINYNNYTNIASDLELHILPNNNNNLDRMENCNIIVKNIIVQRIVIKTVVGKNVQLTIENVNCAATTADLQKPKFAPCIEFDNTSDIDGDENTHITIKGTSTKNFNLQEDVEQGYGVSLIVHRGSSILKMGTYRIENCEFSGTFRRMKSLNQLVNLIFLVARNHDFPNRIENVSRFEFVNNKLNLVSTARWTVMQLIMFLIDVPLKNIGNILVSGNQLGGSATVTEGLVAPDGSAVMSFSSAAALFEINRGIENVTGNIELIGNSISATVACFYSVLQNPEAFNINDLPAVTNAPLQIVNSGRIKGAVSGKAEIAMFVAQQPDRPFLSGSTDDWDSFAIRNVSGSIVIRDCVIDSRIDSQKEAVAGLFTMHYRSLGHIAGGVHLLSNKVKLRLRAATDQTSFVALNLPASTLNISTFRVDGLVLDIDADYYYLQNAQNQNQVYFTPRHLVLVMKLERNCSKIGSIFVRNVDARNLRIHNPSHRIQVTTVFCEANPILPGSTSFIDINKVEFENIVFGGTLTAGAIQGLSHTYKNSVGRMEYVDANVLIIATLWSKMVMQNLELLRVSNVSIETDYVYADALAFLNIVRLDSLPAFFDGRPEGEKGVLVPNGKKFTCLIGNNTRIQPKPVRSKAWFNTQFKGLATSWSSDKLFNVGALTGAAQIFLLRGNAIVNASLIQIENTHIKNAQIVSDTIVEVYIFSMDGADNFPRSPWIQSFTNLAIPGTDSLTVALRDIDDIAIRNVSVSDVTVEEGIDTGGRTVELSIIDFRSQTRMLNVARFDLQNSLIGGPSAFFKGVSVQLQMFSFPGNGTTNTQQILIRNCSIVADLIKTPKERASARLLDFAFLETSTPPFNIPGVAGELRNIGQIEIRESSILVENIVGV
jgi:hypothetical protein